MVKQSLEPWLADFIWEEVAAAITWKNGTLNSEVKPDPDSRFSDDGTNFRSTTNVLPSKSSVQLIEVLSVKDRNVVISDGQTRVRARLSQGVVATLEDEAEDKFSFDMTHDVFQVQRVTTISTVFGPDDGWFRLDIDDIEYEHHLRRVEGTPQPVEKDSNLLGLIDDIIKIRRLPTDQTEDERSQPSQLAEQSSTPAEATIAVPRSSPPAPIVETQGSHSAIQSQYPTRQKPTGPSLAKDGYEVGTGINLQRPVQVVSKDGPVTNVDGKRPANSTEHLLGLFQKRPREAPAGAPVPQQSPSVVSETPARPVRDTQATFTRTQRAFENTPAATNPAPPSAQPQPQPKATPRSLHSSGRERTDYRRRKIPGNQRKLLDRKDSWLPSLPGQSFPAPSVPIELLKNWNDAQPIHAQEPSDSQSRGVDIEVVDARSREKTPEEPEEDSSSEEEFVGSSQWPESPERRPELPPDSSLGSGVRGTPQDDLEIVAPRAMPPKRSDAPNRSHSRHPMPSRAPEPVPAVDGPAEQELRAPPLSRQAPQPSSTGTTREEALSRSRPPVPYPNGQRQRNGSSPQSSFQERSMATPAVAVHMSSSRDPRLSNSQRPPLQRPSESQSRQVSASQTKPSPKPSQPASSFGSMSPPRAPRSMIEDSQRSPAQHPALSRPPPSAPRSMRETSQSPIQSSWRNPPMVGRGSLGSQYSPAASSTQSPVQARRKQASSNESPPAHVKVTPDQSRPESSLAQQVRSTQPMNGHRSLSEQRSAINQHPDDAHREARRGHMLKGLRRDWLQNNFDYFQPDAPGADSLQVIFEEYRKHRPKDDTVTAEDFSRAVEEAFPNAAISPADLTFKPKKRKDSSTRLTEDRERRVSESREQAEREQLVIEWLLKTSPHSFLPNGNLTKKGRRRMRSRLKEMEIHDAQHQERLLLKEHETTEQWLAREQHRRDLREAKKERRRLRKQQEEAGTETVQALPGPGKKESKRKKKKRLAKERMKERRHRQQEEMRRREEELERQREEAQKQHEQQEQERVNLRARLGLRKLSQKELSQSSLAHGWRSHQEEPSPSLRDSDSEYEDT